MEGFKQACVAARLISYDGRGVAIFTVRKSSWETVALIQENSDNGNGREKADSRAIWLNLVME